MRNTKPWNTKKIKARLSKKAIDQGPKGLGKVIFTRYLDKDI